MTYNMRKKVRLSPTLLEAERKDFMISSRNKVRDAARERCRYSSLINERDALKLAEAGYGWEDVRGPTYAPRVTETLAKQLVLGSE